MLPAAGGITGDAYLSPGTFSAGFHTASLIAGGFCVLAGSLAAVTIRNPRPDGAAKTKPTLHCGLDAPPVHVSTTPSAA